MTDVQVRRTALPVTITATTQIDATPDQVWAGPDRQRTVDGVTGSVTVDGGDRRRLQDARRDERRAGDGVPDGRQVSGHGCLGSGGSPPPSG